MTVLYTHIGFRADLPSARDHAPDRPAGIEVADLLETELPQRGVTVARRGVTDYSHFFDLVAAEQWFTGMVGLVDDREWLLFVESTLGWWQRLRQISDEDQHLVVMDAIQAALEGDHRVEELQLYRDADHWNRDGP